MAPSSDALGRYHVLPSRVDLCHDAFGWLCVGPALAFMALGLLAIGRAAPGSIATDLDPD